MHYGNSYRATDNSNTTAMDLELVNKINMVGEYISDIVSNSASYIGYIDSNM